MPQVGEVRTTEELGRGSKGHRYIWCACLKCRRERWVFRARGQPVSILCRSCAGKGKKCAPREKRLRIKDGLGYVMILLDKDNFFYPMAKKNGRIFEHRLIMARHLKRCLLPWEVVHHRNGVKDDNRLENLELLSCNGRHNTQLNKMINQLLKENTRLKARLNRYEKQNVELSATDREMQKSTFHVLSA